MASHRLPGAVSCPARWRQEYIGKFLGTSPREKIEEIEAFAKIEAFEEIEELLLHHVEFALFLLNHHDFLARDLLVGVSGGLDSIKKNPALAVAIGGMCET